MLESEDREPKRRVYCKPRLELVQFALDEVSFAGCKNVDTFFNVLRNFQFFCTNSSCKARTAS
jgi:hypothetical protein